MAGNRRLSLGGSGLLVAVVLVLSTMTLATTVALVASASVGVEPGSEPTAVDPEVLQRLTTSDRCMACHNGMVTSEGDTLSFGVDWRSSIMANSARDPYWQASVRREVMDHPQAQQKIETECSRCHAPLANVAATDDGGPAAVFAHLPFDASTAMDGSLQSLAADGVSCTVCHRIEPDGLGTESSFSGGFEIRTRSATGAIYGPFEIDEGHIQVMRSATDHLPMPADHIRSSELCATCHTLITESLGPDGEVIAHFPEQVPYLEWQHSSFSKGQDLQSCQSCHMPLIDESPITSVLGEPRQQVRRHVFRGGNFFMQKMLARFGSELGVLASSAEMLNAANETIEHLQDASAELEVSELRLSTADGVFDVVEFDVTVRNLTGHKLPTAYPSRRVWLQVEVFDDAGTGTKEQALFSSGGVRPDGSIEGNDSDELGVAYEPHYQVIESADQVQIYEPILGDPEGKPTTGLLSATQYLKDNRLLPLGFDKATASSEVAVMGVAADDPSFSGGEDVTQFRLRVPTGAERMRVEVTLHYQPIGYRWAQNLSEYDSEVEPARFVEFYRTMSRDSATVLASASRTSRR